MADKNLQAKIKQLQKQLKIEEQTYINAIKLNKDFNSLKSIRTDMGNLKKELSKLENKDL
jgi:hypothetical protein